MTRLVVIAHAPLASALKHVAAHVFPERADSLVAFDVEAAQSLESVTSMLLACLQSEREDETLILADAFGATPCNAALSLADGSRVRVVAGVNVPMLWRALCYAHEPVAQLVDRAVAGGSHGIVQASGSRRQDQQTSDKLPIHDQVEHSHQQ